jgi:metal-dependent amidase/aminoacylase/carboxypeptidase family protein
MEACLTTRATQYWFETAFCVYGSFFLSCRVKAASSLVVSSQQVISRNTNPITPAVVSFGGIVSNSNVPNVIPDSVELCGTCRTYNSDVRVATEKRLSQICEGTALAHGVREDSQGVGGVSFV